MRICLLVACPFPANHGTPGSIREMAEAISERGDEVHIVTYHMGEDIPIAGPRLHRIPRWTRESGVVVGPTRRRPLYDLLMVFKALQVIGRHRPHLLHAHGYEAALAAGICRLVTGVPVVYSGHNTMADELASFDFIRPKWAANALARFLDAIVPRIGDRCIPHSQALATFFHQRGLQARTEPVINFGINLERPPAAAPGDVRERYGLKGPVVLYAGVMDKFQRLDLLLEAMVHVVQKFPEARLLMVVTIPSPRNEARVRDQARALGIAEQVVLTEPLALAGVRACLEACDVAVIPRPQAPGFPIKLLNYMLAVKPCVMFASSASGLVDRKHALLVGEDTGAALARGMMELLGSAPLRAELGRNAYEFLLEHHDRRRTAEQVCAAYRRTIEARRNGRKRPVPAVGPAPILPAAPAGGVSPERAAVDGLARHLRPPATHNGRDRQGQPIDTH